MPGAPRAMRRECQRDPLPHPTRPLPSALTAILLQSAGNCKPHLTSGPRASPNARRCHNALQTEKTYYRRDCCRSFQGQGAGSRRSSPCSQKSNRRPEPPSVIECTYGRPHRSRVVRQCRAQLPNPLSPLGGRATIVAQGLSQGQQ